MPEWAIQLATLMFGGVGLYAGIRADLAALRARVDSAHKRLDDHMRGHRVA